MPLSEAGLVRYLLDLGLVERSAVVDGSFVAIPASRRNRNFRVECGDARLFVKQAGPQGLMTQASLAREAAFCWLTATEPKLAALAPIVPGCVLHDPSRAILILHAVPGAVAPPRQQSVQRGFPPATGEAAADALRRLRLFRRAEAGNAAELIPTDRPWVLSVLEAGAQGGLPDNVATAYMLDVIRRFPGFERALARLRDGWAGDSLVHGDVKWDNLLLEAGDAGRPRLVDWEMVMWGDAAWDAGSLIQDYLGQTVLGSPLPPQAPAEAVADAAERALTAVRPAIGAFWRCYAADADDPSLLRRSVSYAGARMLQTCIEALAGSSGMTPNVAALLQLSHNVLQDPDGAAGTLLGLS
ncbi:MAG: aminoglycoside phosphotransferase family protein [Acidisphaera sp.]|nr:aminoglycoside phosphotransferase family protein [Acidisphaera sp.]